MPFLNCFIVHTQELIICCYWKILMQFLRYWRGDCLMIQARYVVTYKIYNYHCIGDKEDHVCATMIEGTICSRLHTHTYILGTSLCLKTLHFSQHYSFPNPGFPVYAQGLMLHFFTHRTKGTNRLLIHRSSQKSTGFPI